MQLCPKTCGVTGSGGHWQKVPRILSAKTRDKISAKKCQKILTEVLPEIVSQIVPKVAP